MPRIYTSRPALERFEEKVMPEPNTGCHIWMANTNNGGYGLFYHDKMTTAHRSAFRLYVGEIPKGLHVLHTCDNRLCVNPQHLWLGTNLDNIKDRISKNRNWNGPRPSGVNHWRARFTEEDIREIRKSKLTQKQLAKIFNTCQQHISQIKRNELYKNIETN